MAKNRHSSGQHMAHVTSEKTKAYRAKKIKGKVTTGIKVRFLYSFAGQLSLGVNGP